MREGGWTRPLSSLLLVLAAVGLLARWRWPAAGPSLPCEPAQVRWLDAGGRTVATCEAEGGVEVHPPAGQALAIGRRLELNRATAEDLNALPGVGPRLARELVRAREALGGFGEWDEVDAVPGVGPATLETLRRTCDLSPPMR